MTVANAATIGPVRNLLYRFEIATNPAFVPTAVVGTVTEGQGQTTFTVSSDLDVATMYYWRARATDTESGLSSAFSAARNFTTIAAPMMGLVGLQIDLADGCQTFFGEREFTIEGMLNVAGSSLRFTVPPQGLFAPGFSLMATQVGNAVDGSVQGQARDQLGYIIRIYNTVDAVSPATLVGTAINAGRLTGTFDGFMSFAHPSFSIGSACTAAGFKWTLVAPGS
jgi:hypothetical protein